MIKTALFIATPDMPPVNYVHLYAGEIEENVGKAAAAGFDGVELLVGDPDAFDPDRMAAALARHQMELACFNTGRLVSQFGLTLVHPDPKVQAGAFDKLQSLIRIAGRLKCQVNIGLFRGPALEGKPIAYTRDRFVEVLKSACDVAAQHAVCLNFEPTNRFEINFINTTDDGLDIVRRVDRPNLGLLLDLYHMYLEDPDVMDSIWKARHVVRHFHFSDSDRWPAGLGHGVLDFRALIGLLKTIGYRGFLAEGLVPTENVDEAARATAAFLHRVIAE